MTFIGASAPECPRPEHYSAPDRIATEHQVVDLIVGLVSGLQAEYVVEVGTYTGITAARIGRALQRSGHGYLDTIEANQERAQIAQTTLAPLELPVAVHHQSIAEWEPPAGRSPVDLAFIDGDSKHRGRDARRVVPWCRAGATLVLHDTGGQHKVRSQVEAMERDGLIRAVYLPTFRGVAIATVLSPEAS